MAKAKACCTARPGLDHSDAVHHDAGAGVVPRSMINDLRAQGIPCDVTVDGTGSGLAPMYLETPKC